jgi:hypothetical protein
VRFRTALCLATLFLVRFADAAWSTRIPDLFIPNDPAALPDKQRLSGQISSVSDAACTLGIMKNDARRTIEFLLDRDTKAEGKLAMGSVAIVNIVRIEAITWPCASSLSPLS